MVEQFPEPSEDDLEDVVFGAELQTQQAALEADLRRVLDIEAGLDQIILRKTRDDMEADGTI